MGVGDINGDGRHGYRRPQRMVGTAAQRRQAGHLDFPSGKTSAPAAPRSASFDVNGDGLNDVVTSVCGSRMGAGVVRTEARQG